MERGKEKRARDERAGNREGVRNRNGIRNETYQRHDKNRELSVSACAYVYM